MAFTIGVGPVNAVKNDAGTATVAVTLTGTTAGRHIVVGCWWHDVTSTITSITCSGESNLTVHGSPYTATHGPTSWQMASLANNTAGGDKTITLTLSANSQFMGIFAYEFAGGNASSFFNAVEGVKLQAPSSSTNPTGSVTTTADDCLVVAGSIITSGVTTAGAGYTGYSLGPLAYTTFAEYDLDVGVAGVISVPFVNGTAGQWTVIAAAFNKNPENVAAFNLPALTLSATGGALGAAFNLPMLTVAAGNEGAEFSLPMLTLSATGHHGAYFSLPMLTLSAEGAVASGAAFDLPMLTVAATGEAVITLTAQLTAPSPTLTATLLSGQAFTFYGTAPSPTLEMNSVGLYITAPSPTLVATLVGSSVLSVQATAPSPLLVATLYVPAIITAQGTAPSPTLVATLLTSELLTFSGTGPSPTLNASILAGEILTAYVTAPSPTLVAFSYPAGVLTFYGTAPSPYLNANLLAAIAAGYRTWVLNTRKNALTEYDWAFNSYATFNGKVLACNASGVVELGTQAADNTTDIVSRVRTGQHDLGVSFLKRVPRVYLGGGATGDLTFRVITSEQGTRSYLLPWLHVVGTTQCRVPIGKGIKGRRFQFEVENVAGSSFDVNDVLAYPTALKKRVM